MVQGLGQVRILLEPLSIKDFGSCRTEMRHFVLIRFMNPYLATLFTFLIALAFLRLVDNLQQATPDTNR